MPKLWKTMKEGLKSARDDSKWTVGKWRKVNGTIKCCKNGFHASETVVDAIRYIPPEVIAEVEARGRNDIKPIKQAWSKMRVLRYWTLTREDCVKIAVFASEQVIDVFEKEHPGDDLLRKTIEAAKEWLKNPTKENADNAKYRALCASDAAHAAYPTLGAFAAAAVASTAILTRATDVDYTMSAAVDDAIRARPKTKNNIEGFIQNLLEEKGEEQ